MWALWCWHNIFPLRHHKIENEYIICQCEIEAVCCSICSASILPFLMLITLWSIAFPFLFPFPFHFKLSVLYTYYCTLICCSVPVIYVLFAGSELMSPLFLSLRTRFCSQFAPVEETRLLVNWFHNHGRVCMFLCCNQSRFQKSLEQVWRSGRGVVRTGCDLVQSGHFSLVWGQTILSSLISFHLCPRAQERPFEVRIGILTRPYEERKWEMRFVATLTPTNADVTDRSDKLASYLCEFVKWFW